MYKIILYQCWNFHFSFLSFVQISVLYSQILNMDISLDGAHFYNTLIYVQLHWTDSLSLSLSLSLLYVDAVALYEFHYENTPIQIHWNFNTKKWHFFQIQNSDIFHISAQNIDCGYSLEPPRRGGSNEYPQSMLFNRNKKNNVYPCKPQFYHIKVGFKGV